MLVRRGWRAAIAALLTGRNRHPDEVFDVTQESPLLRIAERDRDPLGAGTRGAADAMHVALRNVRKIIVDGVADAVDVDAARRDIGGYQRAHVAGPEGRQHPLALVLRLVAVDRFGGEAGLRQRTNDLVGAALGAGENEHALD